jgi:hypothetical protein
LPKSVYDIPFFKNIRAIMKFLAVDIRGSSHPYDAKPYLNKARIILKEISERNLIEMTKLETKLLKKEKNTA